MLNQNTLIQQQKAVVQGHVELFGENHRRFARGHHEKLGQPLCGSRLTMRKSVLERDCPGQQIFPGKGVAIFRGAHVSNHPGLTKPPLLRTTKMGGKLFDVVGETVHND